MVVPPPSMRMLKPLVGRWNTTLVWPEEVAQKHGSPREIPGPTAEFRWLEDGRFLHYTFGPSHWLIGADDDADEFSVLYSDDRDVSRHYRMTLKRNVLQMWRDAPRFCQRFEGRIDSRRRTIKAVWEKSEDGKTWTQDFEVQFGKRK